MIAKRNMDVGKGNGLYSSERGRFHIYNPLRKEFSSSANCREVFSSAFNHKVTHLAFYVQNRETAADNFNQFIEHAEELLKLKERVLIHKTKIPELFIIQLTPFWTEFVFRREIFTLLLRCGSIYHKKVRVMNNKQFFNSLNKYHLTNTIGLPLRHFFAGNVNLKKDVPNGYLVGSFLKTNRPDYSKEYLKKEWKNLFKK